MASRRRRIPLLLRQSMISIRVVLILSVVGCSILTEATVTKSDIILPLHAQSTSLYQEKNQLPATPVLRYNHSHYNEERQQSAENVFIWSEHDTSRVDEDDDNETIQYYYDSNDGQSMVTASQVLDQRFRYVFGNGPQQRKHRKRGKGRCVAGKQPFLPKTISDATMTIRQLANNNDDNNNNNNNGDDNANNGGGGDDYYGNDDDTVAANDDAAANTNDDGISNSNSYFYSGADERCSEFLVSFLEGTTDAHDTCEGMMNAYTAAGT